MTKGKKKNDVPKKHIEKICKQSLLDKDTMNEILQIFLTIDDEDMYGEVLQVILRVTESRYGVFGYIDEDGSLVAPSLTRDIWSKCQVPEKEVCFPREEWGNSIWGRAIMEKGSFWNNKLESLPEGHVKLKNVLATPIIFRENVIGLLEVAGRENGYGEPEKILLENIAEFMAPVLFARLERDSVEEFLRESEERYRVLAEHYKRIVELLPIAIFGHSEKEILFTNNAAAKMVNVAKPQELIGRSLTEFLLPEHKNIFIQKLYKLKGKTDINESFMVEIFTMSGSIVEAELVLTPFIFQNSQVVQIVAYNMTRRKKIDEEIIKAGKLESIGLLAGGIAHDFNNLLAVLMGNISLSLREIKQEDKIYKRLKNSEKTIEQAKELTDQLQTFAKGGAPVKITTSIEELIREAVPFLKSGSNIQYDYFFPQDLAYVYIDVGQITQVINNIVINAIQAMPEGGTISISAENVNLGEEEYDCACPVEDGKYVRLMIQDSGAGIDKRSLQKIFDPFFTTKVEGRGLGLATSYSIVKKHGGCIKVESEPGQGTAFYIYFPASPEKAPVKEKDYETIVRGSGRILVMDDEEQIRNVLGEMLSFLGYEVNFAHNGQETIQMFKNTLENSDVYDVVILDLTIPGGMGGKKAAEKILAIDKNAKLILSSGYSEDPVIANYEEYGFKGVIAKPYNIEQLSKVLNEVIFL